MPGCRIAVADIISVRFHQRTVGYRLLQLPHPFPRQNIRPVLFSGMYLNRNFALDILIDLLINLSQPGAAQIPRKIYFGCAAALLASPSGFFPSAQYLGLRRSLYRRFPAERLSSKTTFFFAYLYSLPFIAFFHLHYTA